MHLKFQQQITHWQNSCFRRPEPFPKQNCRFVRQVYWDGSLSPFYNYSLSVCISAPAFCCHQSSADLAVHVLGKMLSALPSVLLKLLFYVTITSTYCDN